MDEVYHDCDLHHGEETTVRFAHPGTDDAKFVLFGFGNSVRLAYLGGGLS